MAANVDILKQRVATDAANLAADMAASEDPNKVFSDEVAKSGMTLEQLKSFQAKVSNGLPVDDILSTITTNGLPIWLKSQEHVSKVAAGYHLLDGVVPIISRENGNITFTYDESAEVDGKAVYFGSINGSSEDLTDLWRQNKMSLGMETYMADVEAHITQLSFKPLYTASHKDTLQFVAQVNDLVKRLGESKLAYWLALQGRYIFKGETGKTGIVSTNTSITFNELVADKPDKVLTIKNGYDMVIQLNTLIKNLKFPSRTHFSRLGATTREAQFLVNGMDKQLVRSLGSDYKIIVPVGFIDTYNMVVQAATFNPAEASLSAEIKNAFLEVPYEVFKEYSKITGLQDTLLATDTDVISGTSDIILISNECYQIIDQFTGSETTNVGNLTIAHNEWFKTGFAMNKAEDKFVLQLQITTGIPATTTAK